MAKQIDLRQVQELIERGQQAEGVKRRLQDQVAKIRKAQGQLADELEGLSALLQEGKKARAARRGRPKGAKPGKESHPKAGSAPEKLCRAMSTTKPMQVADIAKATSLSEGTVKQYLHKFNCFYSAGRGKGYLYGSSSSGAASSAGMQGEKKTRKSKRKTRRKKAAAK